mgnify:CR=1 FL=1
MNKVPSRWRICLNPDCRIGFIPKNPLARCCCDDCRARLNYLFKLARKFGVKDVFAWKYNYALLKSFLDRGKYLPTEEELAEYGFDLSALDAPVDHESVKSSAFKVGNIYLVRVSLTTLKIVCHG